MDIFFSGLASGIDTASLVDQLVAVERLPINRLESQKRSIESQRSRFEQIRSQLDDLRSAVGALSTRDEVLSSRVTSGDEDAIVATSLGATNLGSFDVEVQALARAERTYSNAFAARDAAGLFGTGSFTIQVGSEDAVTIDVDGADTLESVISKINESGASITAGLLFDGTSYRVQIAGTKTGAANAITFSEAGTSLGLTAPGNQIQAAQDAVLTVDTFTITRPDNVVSGAIPGVSLELRDETAGPVEIRVERDGDTLRGNVQSFVDAYNKVAETINAEFVFTGEARTEGSLAGDSTLRQIQSRLRSTAGQAVAGLNPAFSTLASVGIRVTSTGTLELDGAALDEALATDPEAVSQLFVGDGSGSVGIMAQLDEAVRQMTDPDTGLIGQRLDGFDDRVQDLDGQIERMELRVEGFEEDLRLEFAALEQLVSSLQSQQAQLGAILSGL
ncbi:MAG TPA: flagellar filament capping protein FliD [Polyangiaceae bacterium LLY-WYZ-14_1]|nr:flagellar filament capping protein FliD [Polyangiaceae bacterium LLY-WYZ-14_1]